MRNSKIELAIYSDKGPFFFIIIIVLVVKFMNPRGSIVVLCYQDNMYKYTRVKVLTPSVHGKRTSPSFSFKLFAEVDGHNRT